MQSRARCWRAAAAAAAAAAGRACAGWPPPHRRTRESLAAGARGRTVARERGHAAAHRAARIERGHEAHVRVGHGQHEGALLLQLHHAVLRHVAAVPWGRGGGTDGGRGEAAAGGRATLLLLPLGQRATAHPPPVTTQPQRVTAAAQGPLTRCPSRCSACPAGCRPRRAAPPAVGAAWGGGGSGGGTQALKPHMGTERGSGAAACGAALGGARHAQHPSPPRRRPRRSRPPAHAQIHAAINEAFVLVYEPASCAPTSAKITTPKPVASGRICARVQRVGRGSRGCSPHWATGADAPGRATAGAALATVGRRRGDGGGGPPPGDPGAPRCRRSPGPCRSALR